MVRLKERIVTEAVRRLLDTHSYKTDTPEMLEVEDLRQGFTIFRVEADGEPSFSKAESDESIPEDWRED